MSRDELFGADATWSEDTPAVSAAAVTQRYEVRELLGEGSTGIVEAVYDTLLERVVARKRPKLGVPLDGEAFVREAQLTARLQHPTIVRIYDVGVDDAGPYYTMERIHGTTLRRHWRDLGPADRRSLLPHLRAAAEGVGAAHDLGIVHRDLKPANLMLGDHGRTWVVDFGLGRDAAEAPEQMVGTPRYMSPEQARGQAADVRSDVWSLGAILYELLTGRPPYPGGSAEVLEALRSGRPPQPPGDDTPPELAAIAAKALSPHPADRYADAIALAADLAAYDTGRAVGAYRYGFWEGLARWARQHRSQLVVGGGAVVALVGMAAAGAGWQLQATLAERDRAVAAEHDTQHALARSLQARARQVVDRPDEALALAHKALTMDPTLPWARGVLAAYPDFRTTEPAWTRDDLRACLPTYQVDAEHIGALCAEGLVVLTADGVTVDTIPRGAASFFSAGGVLWRFGDDALDLIEVVDGQIRVGDQRLPIPPQLGRRFGTAWPDQPMARVTDHAVTLFAADGTEARTVAPAWSGSPFALSCHPDGACLVLASAGSWLCHDRFATCQRWNPGAAALSAHWRDSGELLAILADGRVVIDRGAGPVDALLQLTRAQVRQARWAPDGFVTLDVTGVLRWHAEHGQVRRTLDASAVAPRQLTVAGDHAVASGADGYLAIHLDDAASAARVTVLPAGVSGMYVDPRGVWASAAQRLWTVGPRQPTTPIEVPGMKRTSQIKRFAIRDDGRALVGVANRVDPVQERVDGDTVVVHARRVGWTRSRRWHMPYPSGLVAEPPLDRPWTAVGDLATAADRVAFEVRTGVVQVLDDTGAEVYTSPELPGEAWAIDLSDDGLVLAYAGPDHTVHRVDLATGEARSFPTGHRAPVATIALSPDGQLVLTGSWDATARVFSADGTLLLGLHGHRGRVVASGFTDGHAVTGSWDRTVRFWDLSVIP